MKKIVFVIEKLSTGGAERVTAALANEISNSSEYEAHIITYLDKEVDEYCLNPKVIRHEIPKSTHGRIGTIFMKYRFLRKKIKAINPYSVISMTIPKTNVVLMTAIRDRKFPFIISERNDPARFPQGCAIRFMRNIMYERCEGMVFQTSGARDYFSNNIKNKSTIICNPLTSALPDRYTGEREHRIVNFCRIEPQKNLKLTIDAFNMIYKEFPDYTLEFYGEGSQKQDLIDYVCKLGLENKVIFHSYSSNIHEKIKTASLFVSSSDYEGISNSMLEAIAIGVPVICTDCPPGGARETIEDGVNGKLVPVGNVNALADAIREMLSNQDILDLFSKKGAELKEKLRVDHIAEEWLTVIEKVKKNEIEG